MVMLHKMIFQEKNPTNPYSNLTNDKQMYLIRWNINHNDQHLIRKTVLILMITAHFAYSSYQEKYNKRKKVNMYTNV